MVFRKIQNVLLVVFWLGAVVCPPNLIAQEQTEPRERPRLKNFGSSLKESKKKSRDETAANDKNRRAAGDEDVIKVDTDLVRTDVLVVDRQGSPVLGLQKEDFVVTDDGVEQEIEFFSLGDKADVPRSIVLIIDFSGSQSRYINTSIDAAKTLVDRLDVNDRMAIVTDDVKLLVNFTRDKNHLKRKLEGLRARVWSEDYGKSLQYSALMATVNEMFDEEDVRPIIIFQTDGDQAYNPTKEEPEENISGSIFQTAFIVSDVIDRVERSRATLYSIISGFSLLGLSPDERVKKIEVARGGVHKHARKGLAKTAQRIFKQQTAMFEIAKASGGFTSRLEMPEQADAIYSNILEDTSRRYLIGYYPKNLENEGKRRTVKIEVRGHPEWVVLGRKTYYAR